MKWDWLDTYSRCFAHQTRLESRLKLAESKAERLGAASHAYERATEDPTPEEEVKLGRLIGLSDRAAEIADRIEERISITKKIASLAEDESILAERPRRRG